MVKPIRIIIILLFAGLLMVVSHSDAQDQTDAAAKKEKPAIAISEEMDDVVIREAAKVNEEFQQKARSLFDRLPLGWDPNTITYLYHLSLSLLGKILVFTRFVEDRDSARDRASTMLEELKNKLSEQMNRAIYILSIVAAIFLPLGLLTGLLGMNVDGIQVRQWPSIVVR